MIERRTLLQKYREQLARTSRRQAFLVHFALSAGVVGLFSAVLLVFWYPAPLFEASGAWQVLRILIGVDVVLGPVLTWVVFKPAKRSLVFDLAVIAIVQLAALLYGGFTIYTQRPYYAVFAVDRFEFLARGDVVADVAALAELPPKPWRGPLYVAALLPADLEAYQRLLEETLFEGQPDIHRRPAFWAPIEKEVDRVSGRAERLPAFVARKPAMALEVTRLQDRHADRALGLLPGVSRGSHVTTLVIDLATGRPIDALETDYWN
jgi:hypothetical protein